MTKGRVDELLKKLESVSIASLEKGLLAIVKLHENQLVDLNTSQLLHGENAEGGVLGHYHNPHYAALKQSLNSQPGFGVVDLKLTGDFQNSFFLEVDKFPVIPFAKDLKTGKLAEAYDHIFGFTPKSKEEIRQDLQPEVIEYLQSNLRV